MARRPIDPAALLARAITTRARLSGQEVGVRVVRTRPWASATFDGEQVELVVQLGESGTSWLSDLPDAESTIRGYYVADLTAEPLDASSAKVEALLIRAA